MRGQGFIWVSVVYLSMKSEYINLELNADEYEFLTLCSRVYHIALEDWLLAAAIIRGHHVGFSRRVLEIRWKLFFWDFFLNLKSSWMPASEDVVQFRQLKDMMIVMRSR